MLADPETRRKTDLGVDLEYIRDITNIEQLAKQCFLKEECQEINNLDRGLRKNLFFKYWTYKEAYLKATGEGVGGLEDIDFKIPLDEKSFSFIDKHGRIWHNETISMDDDYTGAVVVEGSEKNISLSCF
jgi:4'-phosphopantetheinyl transferase